MIKFARYCALGAVAAVLFSCSSLTLENVNFAWPVESVLTVSNSNTVEEGRYGLTCSVANIASEEFQDSTALRGAKLRVLRNSEGFYFLTGPKFRHVYVFKGGVNQLSLNSSIEVSKIGMQNPALNQRPPYVELIDSDLPRIMLTKDDIVEGKKQ